MKIEILPLCFTANDEKSLNKTKFNLIQFLNYNNIPFLLTNFIEYQQNNHKHYHSQLFTPEAHLNTITTYLNKHKQNIFKSKYINFQYVIKNRKTLKYINFNSNLNKYKQNYLLNFFSAIFNENYLNFDLLSTNYLNILSKILKRYNSNNNNFINKFNLKDEKMITTEEFKKLENLINTAVRDVFNEYIKGNNEVLLIPILRKCKQTYITAFEHKILRVRIASA